MQILFAGGAGQVASGARPTLAETVKDVQLTYEDVDRRSFSFDLENYIQERIKEQT